jgi:hypothetical protein
VFTKTRYSLEHEGYRRDRQYASGYSEGNIPDIGPALYHRHTDKSTYS